MDVRDIALALCLGFVLFVLIALMGFGFYAMLGSLGDRQ